MGKKSRADLRRLPPFFSILTVQAFPLPLTARSLVVYGLPIEAFQIQGRATAAKVEHFFGVQAQHLGQSRLPQVHGHAFQAFQLPL